ncbi:MAG TPA: hypothetical protein VFY32_18130, partial [Solirubrobacteraceae bacterium]|nr:hypothetical protein [Solirubrobacteraceae bacterium]
MSVSVRVTWTSRASPEPRSRLRRRFLRRPRASRPERPELAAEVAGPADSASVVAGEARERLAELALAALREELPHRGSRCSGAVSGHRAAEVLRTSRVFRNRFRRAP